MKVYKLFGIKILEILEDKTEIPAPKHSQGAVLDTTPEALEKERERKIIAKLNEQRNDNKEI